MKFTTKIYGLLALMALVVFSSCRKNADDSYEPPSETITHAKAEGIFSNLS